MMQRDAVLSAIGEVVTNAHNPEEASKQIALWFSRRVGQLPVCPDWTWTDCPETLHDVAFHEAEVEIQRCCGAAWLFGPVDQWPGDPVHWERLGPPGRRVEACSTAFTAAS